MRRCPVTDRFARNRPGPCRRTRSPRGRMRQHESDGPLLLFEQMRDQARRAREDRHALQREQRVARIEQDGRNRARDVHRERLAGHLGEQALDDSGHLDVPAGETRLGCDLEQPPRARVVALVQRVPVAGDRAARRDEFSEHGARAGFEVARRAREHVVEEPTRRLGRAENHRTAAEYPGRHRALQRLRRRGQGQPAGLHARHEPVLGDGDQRRVEHAPLRGGGQIARSPAARHDR